ncbi:MAG: M36 family metallopeptidase [Steroidobacteraceae bacterium]
MSLAIAFILSSNLASAQGSPGEDGERHFDARIEHNQALRLQQQSQRQAATQPAAIASLKANIQDLTVEMDDATGAVRSLANQAGFLTDATRGEPMAIAMNFVRSNIAALGLTAADLEDYEVTDVVPSAVTGATRIYLRQRYRGIPVYNGQLQVNVNRNGRIISVNNAFLPDLANSMNSMKPLVRMPDAVSAAATFAGLKFKTRPKELRASGDAQQATTVSSEGISLAPIDGKLMILPVGRGEARLVWNFQIHTMDKRNAWDLNVDAENGQVWTQFDWASGDQYRVYPLPAASPSHVSPLPPADGRVVVTNPANQTASPFGWHDTNGAAGAESNLTQGNNVLAYTDVDANNAVDSGSMPNGGTALNFNFPLNLQQAPSTYRPAAVTNLFYLNNMVHDIQYQYGFNEAAGNFQVNNYGRGGRGNDAVRAEAQDGSGTDNANFVSPPDGQAPRMQMYLFTGPNPDRDGDLDAGIVIHEYGHGISNRLVGGPANASCLTNRQQPGEGLSDWWTLAYTAKQGDRGTDPRGLGTYVLNQPLTGLGIRTQRYSTDPSVNTWTYASINGMAVPHGVGSVWAQAALEVYWKLVDKWGFDPNLYNATGSAGNQRAMLYVNEGLKNTACNPTFTQVRDGIIQAVTDIRGGEDVCLVWQAFAAFGLGTNAVSGGANSTTPQNGFNVPTSCQGNAGGGGGGGGSATVFQDDFETNQGWQTNANGGDTATSGAWTRGVPQATDSNGPKQLGTATSGRNGLFTGLQAGTAPGTNDVDGGITSILSPVINLPAGANLTLSFQQYLAHGNNATNADGMRVSVIVNNAKTVLFQRVGQATDVDAVWRAASASLSSFAGQSIRLLVESADTDTASLVEAGIDDVRITRQ